MTLTCPACRKVSSVLTTPCACARCAADLAPLWAVLTAAEQALGESAEALRDCNWAKALTAAGRSWSLRRTSNAAGLAFVAAAALGQTGPAVAWLQRSRYPGMPA